MDFDRDDTTHSRSFFVLSPLNFIFSDRSTIFLKAKGRKQGYTIRDLTVELSIPTYQLSVFINQEYRKNFNEFVNDNRVAYLQELAKARPEYRNIPWKPLARWQDSTPGPLSYQP